MNNEETVNAVYTDPKTNIPYKIKAKQTPINHYQFKLPRNVISAGYAQRVFGCEWNKLPNLPKKLSTNEIFPV